MTSHEVAEMFTCSERHIENLVKRGEFPERMKLGRCVRFRRSDIVQFIGKGQV